MLRILGFQGIAAAPLRVVSRVRAAWTRWRRTRRCAMFRAVFDSSRGNDVALLAGRSRRHHGGYFLIALALAVCSGCGHVAAYQRGRLAHPTMQLGDMSNAAEAHVNAVHEGATGGAVGASSGCGCN